MCKHPSNQTVLTIIVTAEDGTTSECLIQLSVNAEPDTLAPVITVTNAYGKAYAEGDTISGAYLVWLTDDSWCWYTLYRDGEEVEEVEITTDYSLTEYTIEACDVFGNISAFTFKYLVDPTVIEVVPGDVNGDSYVNDADAELLSRYFAGHDVDIVDVNAAEIDNDGILTRRDAMILARHLAGWEGYTLPYSGE